MNLSPPHTHAHPSSHDHGPGPTDADQAEILDLDAEVLAEHIASITASLPLWSDPQHVVDLGSGTGTGTFALLDRFPTAQVTAVDVSGDHLERLRATALARGVQDRVRTVQADLDGDRWPELGSPELVWASASMHHLTDPARALRAVHDALAPGALLAVVELAGHPRFLPENAPADRPGLEERVHRAADRLQQELMPHRGADWGPSLTAAGFTVEVERTLDVDIDGSGDEVIGRYAHGVLQRLRGAVADHLPVEDLAALDDLVDADGPRSILRRDDLRVRTERTVWAARRDGR
ncbi:methyltransferase type 12 [Brachybacterium sp. P6-10-X1]|uniref:class I SAM-dependent methyltransferase n=1 Tax=Brachybacterium sp. P6-10-X1 TaxID=1903186 RepID=UPI00097189ED|nr:class I SAM-dependent methyltransferase [Brachybacterium sp. P6-10-X1]APX33543.1 methyltransferase type 12 [Brachybacterium sp. P6-10-X1]